LLKNIFKKLDDKLRNKIYAMNNGIDSTNLIIYESGDTYTPYETFKTAFENLLFMQM
jgi:hypothetical protein